MGGWGYRVKRGMGCLETQIVMLHRFKQDVQLVSIAKHVNVGDQRDIRTWIGFSALTDLSENDGARWKPIALTEEILNALLIERPDVEIFRKWLLGHYNSQNSEQITMETATPAQIANLAHWLSYQETNDGVGTICRRWRRLDHILYSTYSVKINSIAQRACLICDGARTMDDLFPVANYSVRISPISRQASKAATFRAFQAAFTARFSERPVKLGRTGSVCMALTFVLSRRRKDRDLDNMSKAILDAFSRAAGFNDRNIHHLDVAKLIFKNTEEYIRIRIRPSALNKHEDIIAPTFHHTWLGTQLIDLSTYMKNKST